MNHTVQGVNIGTKTTIAGSDTGINKLPTLSPVQLLKLGLEGDVVCDSKYHGGVDQAVYVYGSTDYEWWKEELGRELAPGTFGENLTITNLSSLDVSVGDKFFIGNSAVIEATAPRIPCATLGNRMKDKHFPALFRASERSGFYARVLSEGRVEQGEDVTWMPNREQSRVAIVEMFRLHYSPNPQPEHLGKGTTGTHRHSRAAPNSSSNLGTNCRILPYRRR